jgi:hypothetical protein
VQEFVRWLSDHKDEPGIELSEPARNEDIGHLEQTLGGPLPSDFKLVLMRFNGGQLPNGRILRCGAGPSTMEEAVRRLAERLGADFLDPELLLPFHYTTEGSVLAFDRSAGPVADTWPIVDYFEGTGEMRLVFRTFDGWCRNCVADWRSADYLDEFSLDKYLRVGERHVAVEPDVASAHATVAHALRRSGQPERALAAYVAAARCVPPLPWCDWDALKLAVLLALPEVAYESAARLCAPAPRARWRERGTTPGKVADVIGRIAPRKGERARWVRLLDQLEMQAEADELEQVRAVRHSLVAKGKAPAPVPPRASIVPAQPDPALWWRDVRDAYERGELRDDDLLLDPQLLELGRHYKLADLLRIRREF